VRVLDGVKRITFENEAFPMLLRAHSTCEVSLDLLPLRKPAIPASILRYGSILIAVTFKPKVFRSRPDEEAESTCAVSDDETGPRHSWRRTYNPFANSGDHTWYKVNDEDSRNQWLHTHLLIPGRTSSWRLGRRG
jgi:hypothetical protein